MKSQIKIITWVLALLAVSHVAHSQYEITRSTLNSGGQKVEQGRFVVQGSLGQTDAGESMSAGTYQLSGGFWQANNDLIFKNSFK